MQSARGEGLAEVAPVLPAILAAGLLVSQQVAGKAIRDAFFLSQFDVTALPLLSVAAALLSLLAVLAFARGMAVLSPGRLVPLAVAASALLFVGEWGASVLWPRLAAIAVYLHMATLSAILVSGLWSMINERFDPYSARQAVSRIGTGAAVGGLIGGLLTWRAATLVSVPAMLLGLAALDVLCLVPLLRLSAPRAPLSPPEAPRAARPVEAASSGLRLIRSFPYLRDLGVLAGLCAFADALVDYLLNAAAAARYEGGGALLSFFALFHTAIGLAALILQATLTRTSLGRLGLVRTLAIQPAFMAAGGVLVFFAPGLSSVALVRGGQAALRNSLFRSAYELLYTPLPEVLKRPTKAILDVGFDRLGTAAGSAVVMVVLLLQGPAAAPSRILLALAAAAAVSTVLLAPRFGRGYVAALAESLKSGAVRLDRLDVVDATTLQALSAFQETRPTSVTPVAVEPRGGEARSEEAEASLLQDAADLRSADPQRIRRVLDREVELHSRLVSDAIPLLARDDMFPRVLKSLRKAAPRCTGQLVDALLDPTREPVVRRRIPRVLAATPTQRAADGLLQGLEDERFDLRKRCAQALVRITTKNPAIALPGDQVMSAALREIERDARSGRTVEYVFALFSLALEREPMQIALRALRSDDQGLRGTALEYLDNVLPSPIRKGLWPLLGSPEHLASSRRSLEEIRDDLLRSTAASGVPRSSPGEG